MGSKIMYLNFGFPLRRLLEDSMDIKNIFFDFIRN